MPPVDFAARAQRLRDGLSAQGLPVAFLVTDLANVAWLTGLAASNAAAVLLPDSVVLVTDSRYRQQAQRTGAELDVRVERNLFATAADALLAAATPAFCVEADDLTVAALTALSEVVDRPQGPEIKLIQTSGVIERLRKSKDDHEIESLTRACEITTGALGELVHDVVPGMTEIAVARRLELLFGELGAQDRAFASIVATGPNSAVPHHEPTGRAIAVGDVLKIDCGAKVDGYHADCTRTFIVGGAPTARQREVHQAVADAAAAARDALVVGIEVAELDEIARAVLADAGFEQYFTHGLGHGVGLAIHESPLLAKSSAGTICDGAVVTIEPGVYLPGEFGVRIEDTCHVTSAAVTILTNFPRELARIA